MLGGGDVVSAPRIDDSFGDVIRISALNALKISERIEPAASNPVPWLRDLQLGRSSLQ